MADPGVVDRNVAILMDFENTKDANLQRVLSNAAGYGQVIIRRAYADWTRFAYAQNRLREAGFEAVHQFTTGAGSKNSTDISLTVDAMDLLWSRPVDVFLLVTADSDFAKLAMRLREGGKLVVGMGAKGRVGRALVQACDHYVYYDEEGTKKSSRQRGRSSKEAPPRDKPAKDVTISPLHLIVLSSLEAAADDDGWVYGSPLHRSIRRIHPDFSYRDHGHSTFRSFVESLEPVIHTETDQKRSDFLVWIDDAYEDAAWAAVEAGHASGDGGGASNDAIRLSDEVQTRLDEAWTELAKGGRVSTGKAGTVVAEEYGVDHIRDTPLVALDGVLEAAPDLARKWRRDRNVLIKKSR